MLKRGTIVGCLGSAIRPQKKNTHDKNEWHVDNFPYHWLVSRTWHWKVWQALRIQPVLCINQHVEARKEAAHGPPPVLVLGEAFFVQRTRKECIEEKLFLCAERVLWLNYFYSLFRWRPHKISISSLFSLCWRNKRRLMKSLAVCVAR
jgi:hypothetical protein